MKIGFLLFSLAILGACAKPPLLSTAKSPAEAFAECHEYTESKDFLKASECFELLKSRYPGTPEAIEAEIEIADNYFSQKDYLVAVEAYKAFARLHPVYHRINYVYYRIGQCYLKATPKSIDRDQQYLDDAIHYLTLTMNDSESTHREIAREQWTHARKRIAERSFYIGRFYFRTGEYLSAIPRFEEVVTKYTDLGLDEQALYYLGRSYLKIDRKDKALDILGVFDQHFPESRYRKKLARKTGIR